MGNILNEHVNKVMLEQSEVPSSGDSKGSAKMSHFTEVLVQTSKGKPLATFSVFKDNYNRYKLKVIQ